MPNSEPPRIALIEIAASEAECRLTLGSLGRAPPQPIPPPVPSKNLRGSHLALTQSTCTGANGRSRKGEFLKDVPRRSLVTP